MKKSFFRLLLRLNNWILPRYSKKDPTKLSKLQQAVVAYRYYVLVQSLD